MLNMKRPEGRTSSPVSVSGSTPGSVGSGATTPRVASLAPTVFCPPANLDRCLREISGARRAP